MDPEPAELSITNHNSLTFNDRDTESLLQEEDPFRINSPSIVFFGLTIAIATVAVPLFTVMSVRPPAGSSSTTTVIESNGSKESLPLSITRFGKPGG